MKDKLWGYALLALTLILPYLALAFLGSCMAIANELSNEFAVVAIATLIGFIGVFSFILTWLSPHYFIWFSIKNVPTSVRRAASVSMLICMAKSFILQACQWAAFLAVPIAVLFAKKDAKFLPSFLQTLFGRKDGLDGSSAIHGFLPGSYGHRVFFLLKDRCSSLALKLGSSLTTGTPFMIYGDRSALSAFTSDNIVPGNVGVFMISCGSIFELGSLWYVKGAWYVKQHTGHVLWPAVAGSDTNELTSDDAVPLVYDPCLPVRGAVPAAL